METSLGSLLPLLCIYFSFCISKDTPIALPYVLFWLKMFLSNYVTETQILEINHKLPRNQRRYTEGTEHGNMAIFQSG